MDTYAAGDGEMSALFQFENTRGSEKSRGRQRQAAVTTIPRRSRSAEASRPQYKDSRRVFASPTRNTRETQALYNSHHMSMSEPAFHDVDESRMKHSRSLSPAFPRRLTATPYDPFLLESRNRDLYQRYAEESFSQRYANDQQTADSLLMFSDAFETGSALTGWSEQELLQKKNKENESKKEKSFFKKKKNKEPRILNMPVVRKRNTGMSELPVVGERKRYYRGADGPNGAMTRDVVGRPSAPIVKAESPGRKRSWTIAPTLSRSSDVESTQSSSESPEGVTNAAARRWLHTKAKRKQPSDFPLLSTKSSAIGSFGRDAPGPVARRPSPLMEHTTQNRHGAQKEPIEQLRLSSDERQQHISPRAAISTLENDWMQGDSGMNTTPDYDDLPQFSSYLGTGFNKSFDMPDDGSPTSVIPSRAVKMEPFIEKPINDKQRPLSILRNAPRSPSRRVDGTHPLSARRRQPREAGIGIRPRKVQTRFSDSVEQRTYDNKVDVYNSDGEEESNYFNDYSDKGAFPVQHRDQSTDLYDRYELEKMVEELLEGGRTQLSRVEGSAVSESQGPVGKDQNQEISKSPPSESFKSLTSICAQATSDVYVSRAVDDGALTKSRARHAGKSASVPSLPSKVTAVTDMAHNSTSLTPSKESDLFEPTLVPISSFSDKGEPWIDDDDFTIGDDEFESPDELAFMQVVAAVVIQTTARRFLAILSFERRIAAHFNRIVAPELVESPVLPQEKDTENKKEDATDAILQNLLRPAPPPQNQRQRIEGSLLAAIMIQRVFRGWWVRDSLHVDHYCATLVQRMVRGFLARVNFYYDMYRIILAQAYVRMIMARDEAAERLAFVVVIQSHVRGFLQRKRVRAFLPQRNGHQAQYVAAVKIQSLCRSYLMHERYLNTLADVLIVQSIARRWIVNARVVPCARRVTSGDTDPQSAEHFHFDSYREEYRQEKKEHIFDDVWRKKGTCMRPPRGPTEYHADGGPSVLAYQPRSANNPATTSTAAKARAIIESRSELHVDAPLGDYVSTLQSRPGSDDPLSPIEATPQRGATAVILATPSDEGSMDHHALVTRSMERRAVAVSPRNFSFDSLHAPVQYRRSVSLSFEESPKPYRSAVNAAREALQNDVGREGQQIQPGMQPSVPFGVSPRRRVPRNSVASFWEEKTASQPKPMFPPKGWR